MPRAATAKAKPEAAQTEPASTAAATPEAAAIEIALHLIDDNPDNPRPEPSTDQERIDEDELTASIAQEGVLQPIMVRPHPTDAGRFVVVMGARRRRCSINAAKLTIPCVVRELTDAKAYELAAIENLQRADMSPMAEAKSFKRILDARLAADPNLKLREAKEVIAEATKKSTRYVELRLQLLTLPAILQAEVASGQTTPKDAILRQRQMPKLKNWTPRQWLTLLEVLDKSEREPRPTSYDWETPNTLCRTDVRALIEADPEIVKLWESYDLDRPNDVHDMIPTEGGGRRYGPKTGFVDIGIHSSTHHQLRLLAKDRLALEDEADADLHDAKLRAKLLAKLRDEAGIAGKFKAGEYVTPWLNGPFDPSPERLAEIAAEVQAQADREAGWARKREEEQASRQAAADRQARDNGEPGQALLAQVMTLQDDAENGRVDLDEFRTRFAEILQGYGFPGPFTVAAGKGDDAREVTIVDGAGDTHGGSGYAIEAKRRLICMAMNFACGGVATSGPPLPEPPPQAEPTDDDTSDDDEFDDDAFDDDDDGPFDDEDEAAPPAEGAAADEETPDFLLRLAGGQPKAEARP